MIKKLLLVVPLLGLFAAATAPSASADTFVLNVDFCPSPCLSGGIGGTVTLAQTTPTQVTFLINLNSSLDFYQGNGLDAFMFNDSGSQTLAFGNLTAGYSATGIAGNYNEGDAGNFDYVISKTSPGVGGSQLIFTVDAPSALTVAEFAYLGSGTGTGTDKDLSLVFLAANVSNGACTGLIGAGSSATVPNPGGTCSSPPSVPEPVSLVLLGSGLAFLGARRRRKKA